MNLLLTSLVFTFLSSANSLGFHGFHFKGLEEPPWVGTRSKSEKWIDQPVDHFNHRDNRTWRMRYFDEEKYFNASGPIFIMLGGEWAISPGALQSGLMHDLGKEHGALMFYTEHRYYGISKPTQNMKTDNMQYLSVDQALADIAYFVDYQKNKRNISNSTVIVFGGSYAGNMATWVRIKYPHLIQGALASSAPIYAKTHFHEYYEVVTASLKRYSTQCAADVKKAFEDTEELVTSKGGAKKIKKLFNLCETPNVKSRKVTAYLMNFLTETFASTVQYNQVKNNTSRIGSLCNNMTNSSFGSPIERLANLVKKESNCTNLDYFDFIKVMKNETWDDAGMMRQWFYQTCTEFGYFQTADNSSRTSFGSMIDVDFFINVCTDVFGEYYERSTVDYGVNRTNIVYGGSIPDVKNVIFVNGDVDPWHALSVLKDLNEGSPAILINGTSHCQDLGADSPNDIPALTKARKKIKKIVSSWVAK